MKSKQFPTLLGIRTAILLRPEIDYGTREMVWIRELEGLRLTQSEAERRDSWMQKAGL